MIAFLILESWRAPGRFGGGGVSIVLLEDDPDDVYFVRRALEGAGIRQPLVVFDTAPAARAYHVNSYPRPAPVLFLIDQQLIGSETGLDFLRWVRHQAPPLGPTPAIMLTASDRPEDRDDAEFLGAIYYLQKPVTHETLAMAVQSLRLEELLEAR
jgi:CheY-like chemotaxis protein